MFLSGSYNQVATYWAPTSLDGMGTRQFASPRKIKVRWEDRSDLMIQYRGEAIQSKACVYTQEQIAIGGYLAKGDQTSTNYPPSLATAYLAMSYKEIPAITGSDVIREVLL